MNEENKKARFSTVLVKSIFALFLCTAMLTGLLSQSVFAYVKNTYEAEANKASAVSDLTVSAKAKETVQIKPETQKASVIGKYAFSNKSVKSAEDKYSYNLGINPEGSGTVKEDWNGKTCVMTLTAVPNSGVTFKYWTEVCYENGSRVIRKITDSDPYNPVLSWTIQPYVARTVIANFKYTGSYYIYDLTKDDGKGTLSVSGNKNFFFPGDTVTLNAKPSSGYRLAYLQYGLDTGDLVYDSDVNWQNVNISNNSGSFTMPASDVYIRAIFYSTSPHTVTLTSSGTGSITFANGSTTAQVNAGEKVSFVVNTVPGNVLRSLSGIPSDFDYSTYSFTMPDHDVNVHAEFMEFHDYALHIKAEPPTLGKFAYGKNEETGVVAVGAIPNNNSILFTGWYDGNGNLVSTEQIYSFVHNQDTTLIAKFIQGYHVYIASNIKNGTLTISPEKDYYAPGEKVKLLATPNDGYVLDTIGMAVVTDGVVGQLQFLDTDTVTIGETDIAVSAWFDRAYNITAVSNVPEYCTATGSSMYVEGSLVTLTANPDSLYEFLNWTENGNVVSTSPVYEFYADRDRQITANFRRMYVVAAYGADSFGSYGGGGVVSPGNSVTVNAYPYSDCVFVNWTVNGVEVSTDPIYTFKPTEDTEIVGHCRELYRYNVVVYTSNSDYGNVYGTGTLKEGYDHTVRAEAKEGCRFINWTVDGTEVSKSAEYTFKVNSNINLTANFEPIPKYTVTAQSSDSGYGTVSGSGTYTEGTSVTVNATVVGEDCYFINWTVNGKEVSKNTSYTFTPDKDTTVVANFGKTPSYTVTAEPSNSAYGAANGSGVYKKGTSVTVTALTADDECLFINWTKDGVEVSTSATYTFTVDSDVTLIANFRRMEKYSVTALSSDEACGLASGSGLYRENDSVTVTATANDGYTFTGWTVEGAVVSTSAEYTFKAEANIELTAQFVKNEDIAEFVPGDINGDSEVDNKDVVLLFRYVSGTGKDANVIALDTNGDGEVDNKDVVVLFRYASGGDVMLSDKPYIPMGE